MPLKVVPRRDRKLNRLVKKGDTLALKKGEVLYSPGDGGNSLFLVRAGHMQLLSDPGTPRERVVGVVGPWELFGEEGLFTGASRGLEARAGEATQVTTLDGPGVNRALRTASKTYGAFLLAKEEELSLARALGGPRRQGSAAAHLGSLLLHLSRRLGRTEEKKGTIIPIRLTHMILADLTGCHRSTVTTLLNDWIYDGALRQVDGYLLIRKPKALGGS
ncbi:MAG: Crp/Fnr family transcriptional regulator [Gemmatimonadetes bacterium]|nr:Crp/Fnr family transcriptional regulator [Gemmatimonadota bacterium]